MFKIPVKCLEMRSVIRSVDVISTKTGSRGGTYRAAPPPFEMANNVSLTSQPGLKRTRRNDSIENV